MKGIKRRASFENIGYDDQIIREFSWKKLFQYTVFFYAISALIMLAFSSKPLESTVDPLHLPGLPRQVSIVVPTYKEVGNLEELLSRIHKEAIQTGIEVHTYIVDDNSQDGTEELLASMSKLFNVTLITRTDERGLASAVIRGIEEAKDSVVAVMDADLSHPPEMLTAISYQIITGRADMAVASRYTVNGRVANWPFFRRVVSFGATCLARPLTRIADPMSGFFAFRKELYKNVNGEINALGFKIGLELMVKMKPQRIAELPYTFIDRAQGASKLKPKVYSEYLLHLYQLYTFKFGHLICFMVVAAPGILALYVAKKFAPVVDPEKKHLS